MKNQRNKFLSKMDPVKLILWTVAIGSILLIVSIIETLFTENFPKISFTIGIPFFFSFVIVSIIIFIKNDNKYRQKNIEEAKKELTSEFTEVFLNDRKSITEQNFKCHAKVDENGKIICKIHVDVEAQLDTYEDFLKHFHFDDH